jgi:hypothetical protein
MNKTPSFYRFRITIHVFFFSARQISPQATCSSAALSRNKVRAKRLRAVPIFLAQILFQNFPGGGLG